MEVRGSGEVSLEQWVWAEPEHAAWLLPPPPAQTTLLLRSLVGSHMTWHPSALSYVLRI